MSDIEQLARDLLARLSRDYGDYEGELDSEVASLFERGERLLPITGANPTLICDECGRETHVRMNGSCVECAEKETRDRHAV